ncbi:MAG: kynureninase [Candidatus Thorarchaeota archaeon]
MTDYVQGSVFASEMDAADPLASYRDLFHPLHSTSEHAEIYFLGNSLGLQPKTARSHLEVVMKDWEQWGVDAYSKGRKPWISYEETLLESMARIVGARPSEVTLMNSLTVNLHLMLVSFYRPSSERYKILIEQKTFPSDHYAIKSQMRFHGINPEHSIIEAASQLGNPQVDIDDFKAILEREGDSIALILLGGVNYYTGQAFDLKEIARLGRKYGCIVGYDLAHAVGNIPLQLHDWQVDFAVWCTYKYLNGGPAGPGGCFVHQKHEAATNLSRFEGWWGNKLENRFLMQPDFDPILGAGGWQISCISPLTLAPLDASLQLFDKVSMEQLRQKSVKLTGYLEFLIREICNDNLSIITPQNPIHRGCQLSIRAHQNGKGLFEHLIQSGIYCDWREPDVIRIAPVPFYNTFTEVHHFAEVLKTASDD